VPQRNNHTAGTASSELKTTLGPYLEVRTSRAFSAFVSVITPTAAFAASIIKMTYSQNQRTKSISACRSF